MKPEDKAIIIERLKEKAKARAIKRNKTQQMKKHLIYIGIILAILITGYIMWPKPQPADPLLTILQQQVKADSLRKIALLNEVDSLSGIIYQKDQKIAEIAKNNALIKEKYAKEREKNSKLSSTELMAEFIDQTGGRQKDSIYSIPRLNLLNAINIFCTAEELGQISNNQQELINAQSDALDIRRQQVSALKETVQVMENSLELHKTTVSLQADKIVKLEKQVKRKAVTNKIVTGIAVVTTVIAIIR